MGYSVFPAPSAGKTSYKTTLTSGTSWTVPVGVTYVNVTLYGGGGGGGGGAAVGTSWSGAPTALNGMAGEVITSTLATTPAASITYAIGAGGTGGGSNSGSRGGDGGSTTFTGATTAAGGVGGASTSATNGQATGAVGTRANNNNNGGAAGSVWIGNYFHSAGAGGAGKIEIEYWV